MLPLHKLAAEILGWGTAFALSLLLAFFVFAPVILISGFLWWGLCDRVLTFKFVYENTREYDGSD